MDIEARRQIEQGNLDRLKTAEARNRLGQFATPSELAFDIARFVRGLWNGRRDRVRFLDPAIGTGSFYSALRRAFPADLIAGALGIEVDPPVVAAAKSLWDGHELTLIEGDFTIQEPDQRYNLVLTNPPYVRHHHFDRLEKQRLKALVATRLGINVSGLAGLYCYFLLLADAWLEEGGLGAWLIPSEFMDVNYGSALKQYLTDCVTLLQVHRFSPSDVQFCDALVTSAIVIFEKSAPTAAHAARMSLGGSLSAPMTSEHVTRDRLRSVAKWTRFPSVGADHDSRATTLGDFFTIKRGLATGANSFFILKRSEARRLGIPETVVKPILPSSRHLRGSIIEADTDGYPRLENQLVIIDCDRPEEELRRQYPEFSTYLERGKRQGIHQGYLASRRTPWYAQERREPAPFLCTYMGRQGPNGKPFRFFWNQSRATSANVYLLLYPRGVLKDALRSRPELYPDVLEFLQAIDPGHLIGGGRVYGGGLHKMEPKELAGLPAGGLAEAVETPPAEEQLTFL